MVRNSKKGFTLIELMVVIVIIGVLASLAIPRFTEASLKAKVAEAPGVLKGFESAYLAAAAEKGEGAIEAGDLIYKAPTASKWFSYTTETAAISGTCVATAQTALKAAFAGKYLDTQFNSTSGEFTHGTNDSGLSKLVPNFSAALAGGNTPPPATTD
jgi:prepilin-type N-terminal cleavage/methylation domain-containing protein